MSVLVSGCGISFGKNTLPTWVKVLKLCNVPIDDQTGPGITNDLICNLLIENILQEKKHYTHAICQLTQFKKLDVELNKNNIPLMENDSLRNYQWRNYWPSSFSEDHVSKQLYYKFLYSPTIEQKNLAIKLILLEKICKEKNLPLLIILGTPLVLDDPLFQKISHLNLNFNIIDDYKKSKYYKFHNTNQISITPNKYYQIYFADKINKDFLKFNINNKIKKFKNEP